MTALFHPNTQYTLQPSHTPAGCEALQCPAPSWGFREGPTGTPDFAPSRRGCTSLLPHPSVSGVHGDCGPSLPRQCSHRPCSNRDRSMIPSLMIPKHPGFSKRIPHNKNQESLRLNGERQPTDRHQLPAARTPGTAAWGSPRAVLRRLQ